MNYYVITDLIIFTYKKYLHDSIPCMSVCPQLNCMETPTEAKVSTHPTPQGDQKS